MKAGNVLTGLLAISGLSLWTSSAIAADIALEQQLLASDRLDFDQFGGDVAVLAERSDGSAKVVIRDGGSGAFIRNLFYGAVNKPVALLNVVDFP